MNNRYSALCFLSLIAACPAAELKLPSAGFDAGKVPPEGWQIFEFGDNGDIKKIESIGVDDGKKNKNRACLVFEIGGGGGGQGLFTDVKIQGLSVGDQIEFSVKARPGGVDVLEEGKLEIHIEFISDGEPVGRTDELGTSVSIQQQDLSVLKETTVAHKHTISSSDVSDLSKVDTLRFVIVAIQPDDGFKDSYGSVFVDNAAAKLIPANK